MCGFLFSDYVLSDELIKKTEVNVKRRGPDDMNVIIDQGCTYVHYLLHITGKKTKQPLFSNDSSLRLIYNGEIYNYKSLGDYDSDGTSILDAYENEGIDGLRKLDGEFSGVIHDLNNSKIILFRDTFGTKPMFLGINDNGIVVCSYYSQVMSLSPSKVLIPNPNSIFIIDQKEKTIVKENYKSFDLKQKKTSYEDWLSAFYESIKKRTSNKSVSYFIGLSSGYDSGLISAVLKDLSVDFKSYSIQAAEDVDVIMSRASLLDHNEYFHLSLDEYEKQQKFLIQNCEPFQTPPRHNRPNGYSVLKDKGAIGTGIICEKAKKDGCKVYISGQGSDEIISDYGHAGRLAPGFLHGTIAGKFPKQLESVFPWENFYGGTQLEFISKDENVGGTYGIETRYPFLDHKLVQEFLWLSHDLKNAKYKAPIDYALKKLNFPMAKNGLISKVGFRANSNFRK